MSSSLKKYFVWPWWPIFFGVWMPQTCWLIERNPNMWHNLDCDVIISSHNSFKSFNSNHTNWVPASCVSAIINLWNIFLYSKVGSGMKKRRVLWYARKLERWVGNTEQKHAPKKGQKKSSGLSCYTWKMKLWKNFSEVLGITGSSGIHLGLWAIM